MMSHELELMQTQMIHTFSRIEMVSLILVKRRKLVQLLEIYIKDFVGRVYSS